MERRKLFFFFFLWSFGQYRFILSLLQGYRRRSLEVPTGLHLKQNSNNKAVSSSEQQKMALAVS